MGFELAYNDAEEGGGGGGEGLQAFNMDIISFCFWTCGGRDDWVTGMWRKKIYHETQITPLVKEVTVDVDAIRLTQIPRNERSNRW